MNEPTYRPLRDTSGPDQVTGDAVLLDVPAAGIASRVLAGLIDLVARLLAAFVLLFLVSYLLGDGVSEAVAAGVGVLLLASCLVLGPALIETLTTGRSLGKWICGLRAVRMDGGAVSFRHALVRAFVGYVEIVMTLGTVALLTAMFTVRSRRLGDLAAGTYVVREPRRLAPPAPLTIPPQLRGWADVAVVAPMPGELGDMVRMVTRAPSGIVTPQRRAQALPVLQAALPYVTPPPPPGHDPLAVLTTIAVLRRDADLRLLARDDATRRRVLGQADEFSPRVREGQASASGSSRS